MPLECVMILLDNSVFSRNGDAIPTRFQAQLDAASSLINYKTNDNMETCVGLMSMGGSGGQIYATPTNEASALYSQFSKVQIQGQLYFAKSLQIAQLALKHRVNKNQQERIVAFVASELRESPEELFLLARALRRNNVALDLVNICNEANAKVLEQVVEIVAVEDNSHLVNYQGGLSLLSDVLKGSGVFGRAPGEEAPGFQEEVDPELEMVLRISLEEEKKRQEELERQNRGQAAAPKQSNQGMLVEREHEEQEDEEKRALLDRAEEVLREDEKNAGKGNAKEANEYFKDSEFIKEILKDLKIDPKEAEKQKKEEKKNQKEDNDKDKKDE